MIKILINKLIINCRRQINDSETSQRQTLIDFRQISVSEILVAKMSEARGYGRQ